MLGSGYVKPIDGGQIYLVGELKDITITFTGI